MSRQRPAKPHNRPVPASTAPAPPPRRGRLICRIYAPVYVGDDVRLPGQTVALPFQVAHQAIKEGRAKRVWALVLVPPPESEERAPRGERG